MHIREILPSDNQAVKTIIQQVILEHDAPKEGTAYSDAATQSMYQHYQKPRSKYFVLVDQDTVVGCAGVGPLQDCNENIAELQKMYFLPQARGKGYGSKLMQVCLDHARNYRYQQVYIETMSNMLTAQSLYKKFGFKELKEPMGNTGHYSCPVQMVLEL